MSDTGLPVFDKTLQTTNIWLDELATDVRSSRDDAWKALTVVLHRLRNRLPLGLSVNLGAQLPMLVRGVYYDQFQPFAQPSQCDTMEEFAGQVREWLGQQDQIDARTAVTSVFKLLAKHVSAGEAANVAQALPESLRDAWPEDVRKQAEQQMKQSSGSSQQQQQQQQQPGSTGEQRSDGKQGVTQWGAPEFQPGAGVERKDETLIARKSGGERLEPASAEAEQTMVGGAQTGGAAR